MNEETTHVNSSLERSVIGKLLLSADTFQQEIADTDPSWFATYRASEIIVAIQRCQQRERAALVAHVVEELARLGADREKTERYLRADCMQAEGVRRGGVEDDLATLRTLSHKRKVVDNLRQLERNLVEIEDSDGVLAAVEERLGSIHRSLDGAGENMLGPLTSGDWFRSEVANGRPLIRPTGYFAWDEIYGGIAPGTVNVVGSRPGVGKSTYLQEMALSVSRWGPALFVSVEMDRRQVMCRRAVMTQQHLNLPVNMRWDFSDYLNGKSANSPTNDLVIQQWDKEQFYLVDYRGMTVPRIASLARRMGHLGHAPSAIFIDYLNILEGGRGELYQRTTELSRQIHYLARELSVPVVVAAQLSRRGITKEEGKDSKKEPELQDLRDCLPADANVYSPTLGLVQVGDVRPGMKLATLGKSFSLTDGLVKDVWPTGMKQLYRLTTRTGRTIEASEGHRFLVHLPRSIQRAWTTIGEIRAGHRIAVPRRYPESFISTINEDRALLLGWLIGDGHLGRYAVELTTSTLDEAELAKSIADREFGLNCTITPYGGGKKAFKVALSMGRMCGAGKNPFTIWCRERGLLGKSGASKEVPDELFRQPNAVVTAFLRGLFHADGSASTRKNKSGTNRVVVKLNTISPSLATGVHHLLSRLGVVSLLRSESTASSGFRTKVGTAYVIRIWGKVEVGRFAELVGFLGAKQEKFLASMDARTVSAKYRERSGDLLWDTVVSIEPTREVETFDIQMEGAPYFCVNEFLTHNSGAVEQDADTVTMLWTEEGSDQLAKSRFIASKKNRHGILKKLVARFDGQALSFLPTKHGSRVVEQYEKAPF